MPVLLQQPITAEPDHMVPSTVDQPAEATMQQAIEGARTSQDADRQKQLSEGISAAGLELSPIAPEESALGQTAVNHTVKG